MLGDRPQFPPESVTGSTPETRLGETISQIRTIYQGVPYETSQAGALTNFTTWLGLSLNHGNRGPATIMNAIIARRKENDPVYRESVERLDSLASGCLVDITGSEALWAALRGLQGQLDTLVTELYPEHAQQRAS